MGTNTKQERETAPKRGRRNVESHLQDYAHVGPQASLQGAQRPGGSPVHGGPQVRRRGVQSPSPDERHYHERRRRDQPPAERWQRLPQARLGVAAHPKGQSRKRLLKARAKKLAGSAGTATRVAIQ